VGQGREIRGHEAGVSRFENPAGICFPPFLHYAERRILPKPARKRDVPKSQIIATGSTGAIGGITVSSFTY
jgi:hypothetical protein